MEHLYGKYENTELWKILSEALSDLVENQDIELRTKKEFVVGYFCKKLSEENDIGVNQSNSD